MKKRGREKEGVTVKLETSLESKLCGQVTKKQTKINRNKGGKQRYNKLTLIQKLKKKVKEIEEMAGDSSLPKKQRMAEEDVVEIEVEVLRETEQLKLAKFQSLRIRTKQKIAREGIRVETEKRRKRIEEKMVKQVRTYQVEEKREKKEKRKEKKRKQSAMLQIKKERKNRIELQTALKKTGRSINRQSEEKRKTREQKEERREKKRERKDNRKEKEKRNRGRFRER